MFNSPLLSAILVSLKASVIATIICTILGVPLGLAIASNEFKGKQALVTVLNSLLAIPTVVVGLFVYSQLCRGSLLGEMHLLFSVPAIIIGQVILALPIAATFSLSAVSAVDRTARETATMLGVGNVALGAIMISEARYGIMAAIAATFGRLIGEVGISMMLGGNIMGVTRTMTTAIAFETSKGEFAMGLQLGGILLLIALGVNLLFRFLQGRGAN